MPSLRMGGEKPPSPAILGRKPACSGVKHFSPALTSFTASPYNPSAASLRFSKTILEEARIKVGYPLSVSVEGGRIVIEPVSKVRGKYRLEDLVSRMPEEYGVEELDWGRPVGKEAW